MRLTNLLPTQVQYPRAVLSRRAPPLPEPASVLESTTRAYGSGRGGQGGEVEATQPNTPQKHKFAAPFGSHAQITRVAARSTHRTPAD
jgi:hypothetical protein